MHILAAREALERFANELPQGKNADRMGRLAMTTRQLFDQALGEPNPESVAATTSAAWADHNLAVLVADGLADPQLALATRPLFLGVRRRLIDALAKSPDDLAPALALAYGVHVTLQDKDDARLAADLTAIGHALSGPHAGQRLVSAAVAAVVAASHSGAAAVHQASLAVAPALREAVDRLDKRLPNHPALLLERCRLVLLAARSAEGAERKDLIGQGRGLLRDHEVRFGPSAMQRDVQATLVQLASRDEPAADLARDVIRLLELDKNERTLDARRSLKLIKTLARAKALTADNAKKIQKILGLTDAHADNDEQGHTLTEIRSHLFSATGDEAALVSLQENALQTDPNDHQAARTLFERLLKNLRNNLPSPFPSATLDLILQAVPFPALGRLSADDLDALVHLLRETFGATRALAFARQKLTVARDLRTKDFVWKRALALADEVGDGDAQLDLARRALKEGNPKHLAEARLMLARQLLARGEDLDEADDALKPLTSERGPLANEAQQLKARIKADPRYRSSRIAALIAFEDQLGIGTARQHPLRVVFTSPGYLLAEVVEKPAPDFYDHKHLRVMIRAEDLPGVKPQDLQKGDALEAPIRGQDANPERDKEGLRIYWVADTKRIKLAFDPKQAEAKQAQDDTAFGIGSGKQLPVRVAWDGRKKRLMARLYDEQGNEFRGRPRVEAENLPDGMEPHQAGQRGKRMTGVVERFEGGYRVVGKLTLVARKEGVGAGESDGDAAGETTETDLPATAAQDGGES